MTDLSLVPPSESEPLSGAAFSLVVSGTRLPVDTALSRASTSSWERISLIVQPSMPLPLLLDEKFREECIPQFSVARRFLAFFLLVRFGFGQDGVDFRDDGFLDLLLARRLEQLRVGLGA